VTHTVQQLITERRHIPRPSPSVPPTIPPLSFEDNNELSTSLHQRILLHQLRRPTETAQPTTSSATRDTVDDRVRRERAIAEEGVRREQQQAMNLRQMSDRLAAARGMNESNRRRETSDIHRYLTQQARVEASRLEDPETPVSSRGLSNAIDVLRHDDLNTARTQQLIERFHRDLGEVMYSLGRHARRVGTFGDYMVSGCRESSGQTLSSLVPFWPLFSFYYCFVSRYLFCVNKVVKSKITPTTPAPLYNLDTGISRDCKVSTG
jgi:hypothetical protein